MPIYKVVTPQETKLVDAPTKAQAVNHVTRKTITAETVTSSEVVALMQSGIAVEKAEALAAAPKAPSADGGVAHAEVAAS